MLHRDKYHTEIFCCLEIAAGTFFDHDISINNFSSFTLWH